MNIIVEDKLKKTPPARLQLLDISRFVAAFMVIMFHYTFNGITNGKISSVTYIPSISDVTRYGYLGVEFFFMISGYVIFISAKKGSPLAFAKSRVTRLYPSYWVSLIITSCFAIFLGGQHMGVDLKTFIVNLSMLQSYFGVKDVDGAYWTLAYELKFYAVIFAFLFFSKTIQIDKVIITWALVIDIFAYSGIWTPSIFGDYFSYFIAGALLSLYSEYKSRNILALVLLSIYPCLKHTLHIAEAISSRVGMELNNDIIKTIIFSFFILFLIQGSKFGRSLHVPYSQTLGALTYPSYLLHAHIGYMLISKFVDNSNFYITCACVILFIFIVSYAINIIVEKRMRWLWIKLSDIVLTKPIRLIENKIDNYIRATEKQ